MSQHTTLPGPNAEVMALITERNFLRSLLDRSNQNLQKVLTMLEAKSEARGHDCIPQGATEAPEQAMAKQLQYMREALESALDIGALRWPKSELETVVRDRIVFALQLTITEAEQRSNTAWQKAVQYDEARQVIPILLESEELTDVILRLQEQAALLEFADELNLTIQSQLYITGHLKWRVQTATGDLVATGATLASALKAAREAIDA